MKVALYNNFFAFRQNKMCYGWVDQFFVHLTNKEGTTFWHTGQLSKISSLSFQRLNYKLVTFLCAATHKLLLRTRRFSLLDDACLWCRVILMAHLVVCSVSVSISFDSGSSDIWSSGSNWYLYFIGKEFNCTVQGRKKGERTESVVLVLSGCVFHRYWRP